MIFLGIGCVMSEFQQKAVLLVELLLFFLVFFFNFKLHFSFIRCINELTNNNNDNNNNNKIIITITTTITTITTNKRTIWNWCFLSSP